MDFNESVTQLRGIGPKRADALKKLGIYTLTDIIEYFPRTYIDLTDITNISDASDDLYYVVKGKIISHINIVRTKNNMIIIKFIISDSTGEMNIILFSKNTYYRSMEPGCDYLFYGKVQKVGCSYEMSSPMIESVSNMCVLPVYRLTKNIPQNRIRNIVDIALENALPYIQETLPDEIIKQYGLMSLNDAYLNIHHPVNINKADQAEYRFAFEELLLFSLGVLSLKSLRAKKSGIVLHKYDMHDFYDNLPYSLTHAQNRVIDECMSDMLSGKVMNRIVQGDVGSGKTAIAACLMYITVKNGFQTCIMAPTEILASQHFTSFSNFFDKLGIKISLLTSSTSAANRKKILSNLKCGNIDVLIGTHAIIQDDVEFKNLSLVITDEQHRFGVQQRAKLASKGINPHILVMSATPIPRTLSMILYGDLDVSIVDELPMGRKKINTFFINSDLHERMYSYIRKQVKTGLQAYIVCPLVEENNTSDLKSVEKYAEEIKNKFLYDVKVEYLHGRMSGKQKKLIMNEFISGKIQVLVSTTVIEVGVNVPNATFMIIENAERFGLSQLHQLRGRVGRGSLKSYCFVVSDVKSGPAKERLDAFCGISNGFEISKKDLELRGPGDFFGYRQSGIPIFRHVNLCKDYKILEKTSEAAKSIIENPLWFMNPHLKNMREAVTNLFKRFEIDMFN